MRIFFCSSIVLFSILLMGGVQGCKSVPKKVVFPYKFETDYHVKGDSLFVIMTNPLHCPSRINFISKEEKVTELLSQHFPLILAPNEGISLSYPTDLEEGTFDIRFSLTIGDPSLISLDSTLSLPFPRGKSYKIIQAYNGSYSHNSAFSRYAVDFGMPVGDTVCAAAEGYVVGVIEAYKHGGKDRKWRPYSNYITLYHPEKRIFTQYVHLKHKGSMVEVGEKVLKGQSIGLSGMTGFTDVAHLHFNVLKPDSAGASSMKAIFEEGFEGSALKRGQWVKK